MTGPPTLAEVVPSLRDVLADRLDDARVAGGTLDEVRTLVRGQSRRGAPPERPAVFLFVEGASRTAGGTRTAWQVPVWVAAMVTDTDPARGESTANRLAATAAEELVRRGRSPITWVRDLVLDQFDAHDDRFTDGTVFGAAARLTATVITQEA